MVICLTIVFVIFAILIGIMIYDSNRFVVSEYTINSNNIEGSHDYLFISDLHCKKYGKDNIRLKEVLNGINAEGCFVTGDMLTFHIKQDYKEAVEVLKGIRERMPVYYSMGNHEYRLKIYDTFPGYYDDYTKMLSEVDIRILDDETVTENGINVSALSIDDRYYTKFKVPHMDVSEISDALGEKKDGYTVLLAHNPQYIETYAKWGGDLILSGHYHGGMVRLPFLGGVISPAFRLFPKYSGGHYRYKDSDIVVNKGLGAHTIPFRLFNPAEIIILHLVGVKK